MSAGASDLERATRVERTAKGYRAELSRDWEIWGPNGGYLATFALRATGQVAQIDRPVSFYCHFLSSPEFAAVELDVRTLKRGRRTESFAVEMSQRGKPILHALVKTAAQAPGYSHQHPAAPAVPPPAELKSYDELLTPQQRPPFSFWENIERRPIDRHTDGGSQLGARSDDERGVTARDPSRAPVVREWTRFRPRACFEDPFVDAARALILLDTYGFPAAWRRYRSWEYLAPNLDTSAWFHGASPDCEWLLVDHECTVAADGLMGVRGSVWNTSGRLLATGSAQLCCVPGGGRGPRGERPGAR